MPNCKCCCSNDTFLKATKIKGRAEIEFIASCRECGHNDMRFVNARELIILTFGNDLFMQAMREAFGWVMSNILKANRSNQHD